MKLDFQFQVLSVYVQEAFTELIRNSHFYCTVMSSPIWRKVIKGISSSFELSSLYLNIKGATCII